MTTICRIVLTVVTCTTNPDLPTPSPAEAVAILSAGGRQFFVPESTPPWERYGGDDNYPRANGSDQGAGGLVPIRSSGARRLDGTSLDDPPAVYGALPFPGYGRHRGDGIGHALIPGYFYGAPRLGSHERGQDRSHRGSRAAAERPQRGPQPQTRPAPSGGALPAANGGVRVGRAAPAPPTDRRR